ncbi:uncharacterized protein LOC120106826 [Phoenix dactylifera]|uniref:Uncharacterized protein LOC120106826 n=1 Tax=Phoenix dactylifera TaxID=42345 RepID=A0A8B8ZWB6_PHODC|nr:uncharacterized protein LOC120106826 [Phoenix dactylifera]
MLAPPAFQGTTESFEADNWLTEMEKAFAVLRCRDDEKLLFASYMLQGEAFNWWQMLEHKFEHDGEPLNWDKFRKAFYDKYFPRSVKPQKEQEFIHLKQRGMTVAEYEAKFTELAKFVLKLVEDEQDRVHKFEMGLKTEIRKQVVPYEFTTYAAVVNKALIIEREVNEAFAERERNQKKRNRPVEFKGGNKNFKNPAQKPNKDRNLKNESGKCSRCGVVTGTIPVSDIYAYVLFDPGATHSFISSNFVKTHDILCESMTTKFYVETPVGDRELPVDLIVLDMRDFDVILGMNWLATYHASVDCHDKRVNFQIPGKPTFSFCGNQGTAFPHIISALQAGRMLRKGCTGYLASVIDIQQDELKIEDIPIVNEFSDVFSKELSGLPPDREIEFTIDLVPGSGPISKAPYRMAPAELKELKDQLQDLLDKGFIRPSVSP